MNSSRLSTTLAPDSKEARTPFNLLVAYEDQPTRHRALHLSHHLSNQFAEDYDFRCSWWKFDHLANGILREQATHAATEANMIVLAVNARSQLSSLQSEWLESWLPLRRPRRSRNTVNGALVALVALMANPEPGLALEARQTTEHLRKMASAAHLDFFSHSFELPQLVQEPTEALVGLNLLTTPELVTFPAPMASPLQRLQFKVPIPRWGINE